MVGASGRVTYTALVADKIPETENTSSCPGVQDWRKLRWTLRSAIRRKFRRPSMKNSKRTSRKTLS